MKSLAGANPEAKPDYRGQALTELNKLESKVILLNEMLDNVDVDRGEKFVTGDAYDVCNLAFPLERLADDCHSKYHPSSRLQDRRFKSGSRMPRTTILNPLV